MPQVILFPILGLTRRVLKVIRSRSSQLLTLQPSWRSAALLALALRDGREVHRSGADPRTCKCSPPPSTHLLASLPEKCSSARRHVRVRRKSTLQILRSQFRALPQSNRGSLLEAAEARERRGSNSETFESGLWPEIVPARQNPQPGSGRQPWRMADPRPVKAETTSDRSEGLAAGARAENGQQTQMAIRVFRRDGH